MCIRDRDMPYLFANNEEAYKVFDGEIGRELLDSLEDAGLKLSLIHI